MSTCSFIPPPILKRKLLIKFSFQNFFRNFWLSLVTITIIVLSLFSVNALLGLNGISQAVLASVTDKIDISVYFRPGATEEAILVWREQVNNYPETEKTELMRTKENAADYRFIPDPDLPRIKIRKKYIEKIKNNLPESPMQKLDKLIKKYKIELNQLTKILTTDPVSVSIGAESGQVIKIIRKSHTAKHSLWIIRINCIR